jgi:hypothetical protein
MNLSNVLWAKKGDPFQKLCFRSCGVFGACLWKEVGKQEVSMFSGLEAKQVVQRRQRSVAWAWTKARSTMKDQTRTTHAKLTSSVLLSTDCETGEEISNWRDSLAALSHRSLARQICDQFYDLSILAAWRGRSADVAAAERALSTALPSYCQETPKAPARAPAERDMRQPARRALITTAVLPEQQPQRTAVLIPLRSKAA